MHKAWYPGILMWMLLAITPNLLAQVSPPSGAAPAQVLTFAEQMPTFKGGRNDSIMAYIRQNTRYPAEAIQTGASGKVFVSFVVTAQGKLEQAQVVKPVDPALDKEALRVIEAMPDAWQAGRQQDQPVAVAMTVPISFVIQLRSSVAALSATYPGGPEALLAYLAAVPYPEAARAAGLDARVFVKFKIDKDGKVVDARPIGPLMRKPQDNPPPRETIEAAKAVLEEAAVRWIKAMPAWMPPAAKGVPLAPEPLTLPLVFNPASAATPPDKVYAYADQMPVFGTPTLKTDIQASIQRALKYPPTALRNRLEGVVYLYFVVNEAGALERVQVVKSAGPELNQAVLDAALAQPAALTPALLKGKPVKVFYVVPFNFRIR